MASDASVKAPVASPEGGALTAFVARGFRVLAGITFVLLVFGATVRVHDAGLSCPDWPLCYGELVPVLDFQIFLEWGHRVLAGSISLGFLGLGALVLRDPALRARAGWFVGAAVLVLATQIVLGGLTVLKLLAFWSVTLHLLTGNLFLASLLTLADRVANPAPLPVPGAARALSWAALAAWVLQMSLGGLVSSNYAGLACTEWPTCNGGVWFPTWSGIIGLQLAHRFGAYLLTAVILGFFVATRKVPALSRFGTVALALVLGQVALGVTNVLVGMPEDLAILHSAVADAIGVTLVLNALRVARSVPVAVAAPAPVPTLSVGRA